MGFVDREDAGRQLAARLDDFRTEQPVVLGLPRGGVPVAAIVAASLGAPLDVILVRKLSSPLQPEFAIGAIGEGGARVVDSESQLAMGVSDVALERIEDRERAELERRVELFRQGHARVSLANRTAIIIDDGVATGATAAAACQCARELGASKVVLAVPVAPWDWKARLGDVADELIALETPRTFHAVGLWYTDFRQTSDDEVVRLLAQHRIQ